MLLSISCAMIPAKPDAVTIVTQPSQESHVRTMQTPLYSGGGAIIFVMHQIDDSSLKDTADKIIRLFGENNAPLDVAAVPAAAKVGFKDASDLTYYVDAGIIDIGVDGYSISWLATDKVNTSSAYNELRTSLMSVREQFKFYFGEAPVTCVLPPDALTEDNYRVLQDSGFKVLCSANSDDLHPSNQPVTWAGKIDPVGLYRLPIVGNVDYSAASTAKIKGTFRPDTNSILLKAVDRSLERLGVAVIEIQPALFLGQNNRADTAKLALLANLVKSCQNICEITTLESWYQYSFSLISTTPCTQKPLPPYDVGPVIISRMDDVSKGYLEEIDQE